MIPFSGGTRSASWPGTRSGVPGGTSGESWEGSCKCGTPPISIFISTPPTRKANGSTACCGKRRRNPAVRNDLTEICRLFREKERFLIACHENPEGDAIGSELALALALRKIGKTATVLNSDPVPGNLVFLPAADTVVFEADGSSHEGAVVVDCGSRTRAGRVQAEMRKGPILVDIDHQYTKEREEGYC